MPEGQRGYRPEDKIARKKSALDAAYFDSKKGSEEGIIELTDEDIVPKEKPVSTGREFVLDPGEGELELDTDKADEVIAKRAGKHVNTIKEARLLQEAKDRLKKIRGK